MKQGGPSGGWRLNLALTAGIMATVLIALVMAQLDALQGVRPEYSRLVIANIQATAVSNGEIISLPYGVINQDFPVILDLNATVSPDSNPRVTGNDAGNAAEFPVCGAVPTGWLLYTVAAGDTVSLLASATQSDANAILAANCLTGDTLTAGMQILLPSEPVEALQCGPPQWWVRYQVRAGDSLGALAANRGTTVAEVLRANCRDSEALTAGQMIFLPPGGPVAPPVVQPPIATAVPPLPEATSTLVPVPSAVPSVAPVPPTAVPPTAVIPTVVVPTVPPVPTRIIPTATPPFQVTATPPVAPTAPPTTVPPTNVPPTTVPPTATNPAPTSVPTRVPPTATNPPPPTVAPSATPVPPTEVPPTATSEPPPTTVPPTATSEPEPTTTPVPAPTEAWPGAYLWRLYHSFW